MDDYRQYLAQKILTEDQPVTYRLLSRALHVHVNTAKEMLYDFHKWQNDKKPGTLFATYLVSGVKGSLESQDEDVEMTDSQSHDDDLAPFSDLVPTNTISLVNESQLEDTLAQYTRVTSIHVYSLAVHPLKDLQLLADTTKQAHELAAQNPDSNSELGRITNPNVRRRERRKGAPTPAAVVKPEVKPAVKVEAKPAPQAKAKEEPKEAAQATKKFGSTSAPSKKPAAPSTLKRQSSSGIGQMFAKAAANPKKPKKAADSTPASGVEDNQNAGAMSDDGEDDTEPTKPVAKEEDGKTIQKRQDRQAELRRMMEESDNEEPEKEESADEPMEDDEPPPPETEPAAKPEEPAEVVSSATGGRRRGRRRVTKKKQIMDDKGYLVTVQEQGWESFSEDETLAPAPAPVKAAAQPVKAEEKAKSKKAAGKAGQGNIMSFFSKK
ncbi:hypothetical protein F5Y18DRAFT_353886 [Xylariaceae sp. FL1019]|nr:hypothetical protein F5Y18DRAFT_353886 [Xylariaceae sp. FL1019]